MKISLHCYLPCVLFAMATIASASNFELSRLTEDNSGDELDEWLAKAQSFRPEAMRPCPIPCTGAKSGTSDSGWFLFPDATRLALCNETMLLSMVAKPSEDNDLNVETIIRACAADYGTVVKASFIADEQKASLCTTANRILEDNYVQMQHAAEDDTEEFSVDHLMSAGRQILRHLAQQIPSCNQNTIEFAYSQSAVIGLFAGVELHQHGISVDVLENLLEYVEEQDITRTTVVQLCGVDDRGADYSIGIVATSAKNLAFV
ncbi:hypothetical protein BU23DRAFT_63697 [Bimuria novae-zelandiae CBS 107.79]|uniref:Uncharacterized protein n=1 Tax=Bimuria novae-zelandiae CBS 107.79 TaxID=1447943 RepID=A0A6A5UKP9_9PLEO|nr:hypothetical protein BU23DRAFT_63697 [Bimuria novae-zelandiae CBS 107.79]